MPSQPGLPIAPLLDLNSTPPNHNYTASIQPDGTVQFFISNTKMKTRFYDRQEDSSPLNGTEVNDASELLEIIDMLVDRPPFICELVGENGFTLSFGLGMSVSHAQYCASDGNPPYFMARSKDPNISNKEFEFLIGGTLTPILGRFCIEFDLLKEIVSHFQKTGYRSTLVEWEEI